MREPLRDSDYTKRILMHNSEITKEKYEYAQARIDALLPQITENTPVDDPLMKELMIVTDIVEAYEEVYCSI